MAHRAHLRLVPAAASAWSAAGVAIAAPDAARPLAISLWCAVLATGAVLWVVSVRSAGSRDDAGTAPPPHRSPWRLVVMLCLVVAAAAASHVAFALPARAEAQGFTLDGGRAVVVRATVTGKVERRVNGQYEFDAVASRIETGAVADDVRVEISVRVLPSDVEGWDALDVGAGITASGTARSAPAGERAVLAVSASRGVSVIEQATGPPAAAAILRRALVDATAGLPDPGAGLIAGLAVGDTVAVTSELDAAMKAASLSHLTAVSGANCALVVGLAFAGAAACGASRRLRVAVGVLALGGFVVLVTPEPSVVRAATMAVIAMLGVLLGRTGAGMSVLCLAVMVLTVADPWLAGSLGFALSSVATASLLLCARPLAAGLMRWMPRVPALALSVPLAAQLACGPLIVLITPSIPLYGVIANLLAGPAAPVATIVGLAACLAAPLPWLQSGLTAIAWLPAAWIAGVADTFSALPGGQIPWLEGAVGMAALALVGLALGVLIAAPRTATKRRGVLRSLAGVVVAGVLGVIVGGAALGSVAGRWTLPSGWSLLACDVGQGDAVLLRSAGAVALVDTGPEPEPLTRCLTRAGIQRVDLLVLTHFDLDHVGGVQAVQGRVGTVLHGPAAAPEDQALLAGLQAGGASVMTGQEGMRGTLGDAEWRVLWPPAQSRAFPSGNDASVVLDVRGGGVPITLLLGDLSASPQSALTASGALRPPYDVVKVAHHGSADQHAGLYATASASLALFTVGAGNDYGHPRGETLAMLAEAGARIARTDVEGVIAVWRGEAGLAVWRERVGEPSARERTGEPAARGP